ncbi:hypothetical protein QQF64_005312 [Cirrhinus molitorella]|uniref:Uncharacterized protein n=1 Tax=Cirrhinus molitorella TaxID=172907 RepID=A0ABR3MBS7_9TELE
MTDTHQGNRGGDLDYTSHPVPGQKEENKIESSALPRPVGSSRVRAALVFPRVRSHSHMHLQPCFRTPFGTRAEAKSDGTLRFGFGWERAHSSAQLSSGLNKHTL